MAECRLGFIQSIPPAYEALKHGSLRAKPLDYQSIPPAYEALKPVRSQLFEGDRLVDPARLRGIETKRGRSGPH